MPLSAQINPSLLPFPLPPPPGGLHVITLVCPRPGFCLAIEDDAVLAWYGTYLHPPPIRPTPSLKS